jgi:hypothetical protein
MKRLTSMGSSGGISSSFGGPPSFRRAARDASMESACGQKNSGRFANQDENENDMMVQSKILCE